MTPMRDPCKMGLLGGVAGVHRTGTQVEMASGPETAFREMS
jgi:hypothetical protein